MQNNQPLRNPYCTWTERGNCRRFMLPSALQKPEVADEKNTLVPDRVLDGRSPLTRRRFLQKSAFAGGMLATISGSGCGPAAQFANHPVARQLLWEFAIPGLTFLYRRVIAPMYPEFDSKLSGYINRFLGDNADARPLIDIPADDFNQIITKENLRAAEAQKEILYTKPGGLFHHETNGESNLWHPDDLRFSLREDRELGVGLGIEKVQRDCGLNNDEARVGSLFGTGTADGKPAENTGDYKVNSRTRPLPYSFRAPYSRDTALPAELKLLNHDYNVMISHEDIETFIPIRMSFYDVDDKKVLSNGYIFMLKSPVNGQKAFVVKKAR